MLVWKVQYNLGRLSSAVSRATDQIINNAQDLTLSVFSKAAVANALSSAKAKGKGSRGKASAKKNVQQAYPLLTDEVRGVLWKRLTKVGTVVTDQIVCCAYVYVSLSRPYLIHYVVGLL